MADTCLCWKCGAPQADLLLPLARLAECPQCRAQLHVCRMCEFFDPAAPQQCREPVADLVADKERANFCGYFRINPRAYKAADGKTEGARQALDALFGGGEGAAPSGGGARSPEEAARKDLEKLFRK
jgi:hypothetical protein